MLRVEGGIGRHPGDRKRMAVLSADGKPAVTRARVLERFGPDGAPAAALLECRLETGRTHQIRVHMAFIGHPLAGDGVYGRRRGAGALAGFPRQALHAASLGFGIRSPARRCDSTRAAAGFPPAAARPADRAWLRRSRKVGTFNET